MPSPSVILYPFSDLSAFGPHVAAKLIYHLQKNQISSIAVGLSQRRLDDPAYVSVVKDFVATASKYGISVAGIILQERNGDLFNYMRDHAFDHNPSSSTWTGWLSSHLLTKEVTNLSALTGPDGLDGILVNNEALGAFRAYVNNSTLSQADRDVAIANSVAIYRDYIAGIMPSLKASVPGLFVEPINPQILDDRAGNVGGSDHWAAGATQAYLAASDGITIDLRISGLGQWDYRSDGLNKLAGVILDKVLWYGTKSGVANNYGPLLDSYFSGQNKPVTVEISERVYDTIQSGFTGLTGAQLQQLETLVAQGILERIRNLEQSVPGFNAGTIDEVFVRDHIFAGLAMVVPGSDGQTSLERFFTLFDVPNQAPIAVNDRVATLSGQVIAIDVLANDYDVDGFNLRIEKVSNTRFGDAWLDPATGKIMYQSTVGAYGNDTFTYWISDGITLTSGRVTVEVREPALTVGIRGSADAATIGGKKIAFASAAGELNAGVVVIDAVGGTLKSTSTDGFGVNGPGDTVALARRVDGDESLTFQLDPDYASVGPAIAAKVMLRGIDRNDVVSITAYHDANGDGVLADDEVVGNVFYTAASDRFALDAGRVALDVSFLGDAGPEIFDALSISAAGRNSAVSVFGVDFYGAPIPTIQSEPAVLVTPTSIALSVITGALVVDNTRLTSIDGKASLETARLKVEAMNGTFKIGTDLSVQSPAGADRLGDSIAQAKLINGDEGVRFTIAGAQTHDIVQAKIGLAWIGASDVLMARAYDTIGGVRTLVGEMRIDAELDPTIARQDVRIGFQDAGHGPVLFSSLELSGVGLGTAFAVHDAIFYLS